MKYYKNLKKKRGGFGLSRGFSEFLRALPKEPVWKEIFRKIFLEKYMDLRFWSEFYYKAAKKGAFFSFLT